MKVLIADDDRAAREALGALAQCYGHEVFFCADGMEVITAVAWVWPDLIILDIDMPGMDGISAARRLGGLYPSARWCLIAYTGKTHQHSAKLQSQRALPSISARDASWQSSSISWKVVRARAAHLRTGLQLLRQGCAVRGLTSRPATRHLRRRLPRGVRGRDSSIVPIALGNVDRMFGRCRVSPHPGARQTRPAPL